MTTQEIIDAISNADKGTAVDLYQELVKKITDEDEREMVSPDLEAMAILIDNE